jgi:uncharacterized protein
MVDHKLHNFAAKNHMVPRTLEAALTEKISTSNKILILYGARQVGKTTLVREVLKTFNKRVLEINADRQVYVDALSSRDLDKLRGVTSGYDVVFIDEAQRIPDIGINLKILHDSLPELKIIVTGSSSLDLANRVKEPLTGRTRTYRLYPVSLGEWQQFFGANNFELGLKLDEFMRFGMYPEPLLFSNYDEKRQSLEELSSAYLYKDILALANIRYPEKLRQLLKLLAYQIGSLVSVHELAITLQVNRDTVINYIDLLEKSFVIFRLKGFSRGIRNAIIENFSPLDQRQDTGALWENFLIAERIKKLEYQRHYANTYFWRTHTGVELDYIEERDGQLHGFEFKWKSGKAKPPAAWLENYENSSFEVVNKDNFSSFAI